MSSFTTNFNFYNSNTNSIKDVSNYLNKYDNMTFTTNEYTNNTKAIQYPKSTTISQNNISVNTEGASNTGEVYTFGKSIAPMWVAGGTGGNTLAYSTDGINFIGLGASIITSQTLCILWNGTRWVAGGTGGNTLAYSNDGINWTGLGTTVFTTGSGLCNCIEWSSLKNIWVAGGNSGNSLAYSYDGINWIGVTGSISSMGNCRGLCWNGTRFIAVGTVTNNFAMSFDGINWTYSNISTFTGGTIISVIYNGTMWFVGGGTTSSTTIGINYAYDKDLGNTASGSISAFTNVNSPANLLNSNQYVQSLSWNGKLIVATTSDTAKNSLIYSYNGLNWIGLGSSIITTGYDIRWDGTKFIATTDNTNNKMSYSYDGINWVGMGNTVFTSNGRCIAYNGARPHKLLVSPNRMVVGTSAGSFVYYSNNNGLTWYASIGQTVAFFKVSYNGYIWLGGGLGTTPNVISYSYDGIIWVGLGKTVFKTLSGATAYYFSWNNTLTRCVCGSDDTGGNTLAYSNDGINWVGLGSSIFGLLGGSFYATYNNKLNMWVAAGKIGNSLAYSYDGINWTGLGTSIFNDYANQVDNNGKMFIVVGGGTGAVNYLAYSYDGINWTGLGKQAFTGGTTSGTACVSITWSSTLQIWVVGSNDSTNALGYSYNGITWTGITGSGLTTVNRISWNKTYFVAVGVGGNSIAYSKNGISFTQTTPSQVGGGSTYGIDATNQQNSVIIQHPTIAVGRSTVGTYNTIAYSPDGIIWYGLGNIIFSTAGYAVAWNGTMWIAVGQGTGNTVAYSIDGVSWTGLGTTIFATAGWCVAWNGTLWVAGGEGAGNTLAYSTNGLSWTGIGSSVFTTRCKCVAWYQGTSTTSKWIAGGFSGNTLASSTDGITWTGQGTATFVRSGTYGIIRNPYNWVVVGDGSGFKIQYSTDNGVTWTGTATNIYDVASIGYGVAWNGPLQTCVAVGSGGNTIAYSTDFGVTWTGKGSSVFTSAGYGVAYNGLYFVASGAGGNTFAWSYDGNNNWTGAKGTNSSTVFDMSGCGIACNYVGTNTFTAQLSMNSNSYVGQEDKQILDIVSPSYYGQGYSEMNIGISSNNLN